MIASKVIPFFATAAIQYYYTYHPKWDQILENLFDVMITNAIHGLNRERLTNHSMHNQRKDSNIHYIF